MGSLGKSRLDHYKQDRLSERFSGSMTPTTASLASVNRKTVAFYFLQLCEIITSLLGILNNFNLTVTYIKL